MAGAIRPGQMVYHKHGTLYRQARLFSCEPIEFLSPIRKREERIAARDSLLAEHLRC